MDYTKSEFWIALAIGGSVCAAGNTLLQLTRKSPEESQKGFNVRSILRDFCIGAFLAATVFMFIPDSITNLISGAQGVVGSVSKSMSGGGDITSTAHSGDVELRLGPARW